MLRFVVSLLLAITLASSSLEAGRSGVGIQPCQSLGGPPPITADDGAYCTTYTYFNALTQGYAMQQPFMAANAVILAGTHSQSMSINTGTFPNGTGWSWTWPATYSGGFPYAFYDVILGDSGGFTTVQGAGHPLATQISKIGTLTTTLNISYTDPDAVCSVDFTGNSDIIYDLWLTSVPYSNARANPNSILFEIEVFVHTNFTPTSATTFTITEGARSWTAYEYPGNVGNDQRWIVTTGSDILSGTINLNTILQAFTAHGVTTGNEYIAGVPFGLETYCNSGTLTVTGLSYVWQNNAP